LWHYLICFEGQQKWADSDVAISVFKLSIEPPDFLLYLYSTVGQNAYSWYAHNKITYSRKFPFGILAKMLTVFYWHLLWFFFPVLASSVLISTDMPQQFLSWSVPSYHSVPFSNFVGYYIISVAGTLLWSCFSVDLRCFFFNLKLT
jgi:hypothetical protein